MRKGFIKIEFEVCCAECGSALEVDETNNTFSISNCDKCIENAFNEGKKDSNA